MITLDGAQKMREVAQRMKMGRPCPTCKFYPFYMEAGSAVIEGHVYSTAGRSELGITGMCEYCFDAMEPDEDREERTGGVIDPDAPRDLPLEGMVLQTVTNLDTYDAESGRFDTTDVDLAQVVTSQVAATAARAPHERTHKVVLDIDLPARLIPSSTEGHFHLYIDHEIPHNDYVNLLLALRKAGLIEEGYYKASLERGFTAARLPWVKKPEPTAEELVDQFIADNPVGDDSWPF